MLAVRLLLLLLAANLTAAAPAFRNTGPNVVYVGVQSLRKLPHAIYQKQARQAMGRFVHDFPEDSVMRESLRQAVQTQKP